MCLHTRRFHGTLSCDLRKMCRCADHILITHCASQTRGRLTGEDKQNVLSAEDLAILHADCPEIGSCAFAINSPFPSHSRIHAGKKETEATSPHQQKNLSQCGDNVVCDVVNGLVMCCLRQICDIVQKWQANACSDNWFRAFSFYQVSCECHETMHDSV